MLRHLLETEIQDQVIIRAWRLAQEFWVKSQLIDDFGTAPLGGKIREYAQPYLDSINERKRRELDEQLAKQEGCIYCNNSEAFLAKHLDIETGDYSFLESEA